MKSFFKKLAFVMALAMVVTLAAPAAKTAVAADKALAIGYQNGMAITEVNIANIGDGEDLRFLYAPANWKELGVKWTSSNENVATVDGNGFVTAVAEGSATVSVAVGTETASVVVNVVELPAYTVSIGLDEERSVTEKTLEIGESVDFAFYGIKDYSRDKVGALPRYLCTWQSDDTTVLTKDDEAGKFTAVAAGTAKVTLTVANVLTGQTHNVIPVNVTVNAPVVEEPEVQDIVAEINKTQNTIEITFDKETSIGLADVEVYRVFFADDDENGDGVIDERDIDKAYEDFYVNTVNANSDKTVYTVATFDDFTDGATYEVRVTGYEPERFVASVGDVAKVEVYEKSGASLETEDLPLVAAVVDVKLYDAKGVDVTTRLVDGIANNDAANIAYWLVEESDAFSMSDYNEVEFYEMAAAKVMATFETNGVSVDSATPAILTPSKQAAYGVKRIVAWTLVDTTAWPGYVTDWTKTVQEVPSGEDNYIIVTLLEDTRGNYFTTHQASAATKYSGKTVYWTEDTDQAFWSNGYYVEYRAMNPDKMLVEDFGEIASYEEGRARFALYLYNQNNDAENEFVKELYSQYVKVCHPRELERVAATTSVTVMTNTEADEEVSGTTVENAYFSLFSKGSIKVELYENHGLKDNACATEAQFEIKLTSAKSKADTDYEGLKSFVEKGFLAQLDGDNDAERKIEFTAAEFAQFTTKNQIKFKITEKVTNTSVNVTINLKTPTGMTANDTSAPVATIKEFKDSMKLNEEYEKFVVSASNITVEQAIRDYDNKDKHSLDGYELLLYQVDKSGNKIGVENNIYVSNVLNPTNISDVASGSSLRVEGGDRILIIKGPDGKVYPVVGETYNNPAYNKKDDIYAATQTTDALGVAVEVAGTAYNPDGDGTDYNQYKLYFRTVDGNGELIYAKNGRYTITIKTVEEVKADGTIVYTSATGLKDTVYVTVGNTNAQVSYAGRTESRAEGESLSAFVDFVGDVKAASGIKGENENMKELILKTFNFNLGSKSYAEAKDWADGDYKLSPEDILYYTYTVTPSNKQVVINSVTFKVPAEKDGDDTAAGNAYGWYRSTCTVNKSITFDYE